MGNAIPAFIAFHTSDYSELPDIWEGNKDWLAAIADLRTRLT